MYREFFAPNPLLAFPLFSLILFAALFVVAVLSVYGRARALESRAALALDDGGKSDE